MQVETRTDPAGPDLPLDQLSAQIPLIQIPESNVEALQAGKIVVTPLRYNRTDEEASTALAEGCCPGNSAARPVVADRVAAVPAVRRSRTGSKIASGRGRSAVSMTMPGWPSSRNTRTARAGSRPWPILQPPLTARSGSRDSCPASSTSAGALLPASRSPSHARRLVALLGQLELTSPDWRARSTGGCRLALLPVPEAVSGNLSAKSMDRSRTPPPVPIALSMPRTTCRSGAAGQTPAHSVAPATLSSSALPSPEPSPRKPGRGSKKAGTMRMPTGFFARVVA